MSVASDTLADTHEISMWFPFLLRSLSVENGGDPLLSSDACHNRRQSPSHAEKLRRSGRRTQLRGQLRKAALLGQVGRRGAIIHDRLNFGVARQQQIAQHLITA